ncbi:MAG: DUF4331 domain-containing protein [Limnobacter sp.]|nr:DUF4331 domain-containing protein [Limnobacter sp.]
MKYSYKAMLACTLAAATTVAIASSHREGPSITTTPKVDGTDFYMFTSYETGREDYVTLIANYLPLQQPYGGPNYFTLDPNALYEIHIDNSGDAVEDLTFQFQFTNTLADVTLPIGDSDPADVSIPLVQAGEVTELNDPQLNLAETYSITMVTGDRRSGARSTITKAGGSSTFEKPVDYIGTKTLPDYTAYANQHIHTTAGLPNCGMPAKVFVGQRQEAFGVNLGPIFDLVNAPLNVITNRTDNADAAQANSIQDQNITTIALEVHKSCLTGPNDVIGGWTSASLRQVQLQDGVPAQGHQTDKQIAGRWAQVSRLGNPLVNEVVIGLKDKDKFNASEPKDDAQFAAYVTNPTLPRLLEIAFDDGSGGPTLQPTIFPREDLVTTYLTGVPGVNQLDTVTASEMLRLNTAIAPTAPADQSVLGVLGGDNAGFPNGRRPVDDVVDISLTAVLGKLCELNNAGGDFQGAFGDPATCNADNVPLSGSEPMPIIHDAVAQERVLTLDTFPYLNTPNTGAGN